ncbi:hypothetical protein GCM10012275_44450 [Longimycelium tulufanense]|uniref:DUF4245 domain-containing protein n=1 Tax=Longimycelium tulufanense TaxID=907463 RepID=A0A8J3CBA4_9PSEU|nr:DUF4245 domain-containing protein [Longimycelium tulufanense]GGM69149.1 hypothetical protein GCM10012275_44450 [Longimycelium tulufanense]
MSTPSNPPPRSRGQQGIRDIVMSLLFLLLIVFVMVGVTRGCSFSPGGPSVDQGVVPTVDPTAELHRAAKRVPFGVRQPELPAGWRANSAGVDRFGETTPKAYAVRVGWLSPSGHYLRLSQSNGAEADLVRFETGRQESSTSSVEVDGVRWTVYPGQRSERAWVTELDGHRVLVTGSGDEQEFRTLAGAVQGAPVLQVTRAPTPGG